MKLIIYTHDFYQGGIDTFLENLLNNLIKKKNIEIELYTSLVHPSFYKYKNTLNSNIKVKKFFLPDISELNFFLQKKIKFSFLSKFSILIKYPLILINSILIFSWFFYKKPNIFFFISGGLPGPDISLCFLFSKLMVSPFLSIKFFFNFHNYAIKPKSKLKKIYIKIIFLITYFISDKLLTVSNSVILDTISFLNLKKQNKLKFIHNGSKLLKNSKKDNYHDIKNKLNIDKKYFVFTILGTLDERKGHKFLLNIYKKLLGIKKDSHLLICGDGSTEERDRLFKIIDSLGIKKDNISFLGFVNDVDKIFKITDILLIGSQSGESFGYPAIEAMQRKIPFVSTNFGGLDEVIVDGSGGYKANYKSEKEFLEKILKLFNLNQSELLNLKEKGFQRYKLKFTDEIMSEKYNLIFKE